MRTFLALVIGAISLLAWQVQAQCTATAGADPACKAAAAPAAAEAAPECKAAAAPAAAEAAPATISPAGLDALLRAKVPVLVFDARSGTFDDGRRIPGAGSLTAESTEAEVGEAAPDKDALIVTYCSSPKCGASAALAKHLRELGYGNVVELPEGIDGWVASGRPVSSSK